MKVPAFLLRRLYVAGSLHNTDDGWGFTLRNSIAAGETTRLAPLVLDGEPIPAERCFFHLEEPVPFTAVSDDRPAALETGRDVTISVRGDRLAPGSHTVTMEFEVPVFGGLSLDFSDEVR